MRTCQKCGAEAEKDDKYCPECGEKVVKEARTITVSTVFKTISMVIFFIILMNVLKSSNVVMSIPVILFGILFIVWAGILNSILKKLFNAEISTGVKIVITLVIVLIFVFGMRQASTMKVAPVMVRPIEGNDMSSFVDRLNNVMNTKDSSLLIAMMEEGAITSEVFKDLRIFMERQDFEVRFKFQGQNVNDNRIDAKVIVIIKTLYEERVEGVQFFFERTDRGWMLVAIKPRLSNLKLSKSFEEETEYKIKQIPQPTDVNKQLIVKIGSKEDSTDYLKCVTEPGKAIYGGSEKCCGGLKAIWGNENAYGECQCTGEDNNCGGAPICAPCGNGLCEKEYGEDRCNCPEDCK